MTTGQARDAEKHVNDVLASIDEVLADLEGQPASAGPASPAPGVHAEAESGKVFKESIANSQPAGTQPSGGSVEPPTPWWKNPPGDPLQSPLASTAGAPPQPRMPPAPNLPPAPSEPPETEGNPAATGTEEPELKPSAMRRWAARVKAANSAAKRANVEEEPQRETSQQSDENESPDESGSSSRLERRRLRLSKLHRRANTDGNGREPRIVYDGREAAVYVLPNREREQWYGDSRAYQGALSWWAGRTPWQRFVLRNAVAAAAGAWTYGAFTAAWDKGLPQLVLGWMNDMAASKDHGPVGPIMLGLIATGAFTAVGNRVYRLIVRIFSDDGSFAATTAGQVIRWLFVSIPASSGFAAVCLFAAP
ncbi:hypothetical protein ACH4PU_31180 [Streptomyces sp. NPDC021100]|uniref:hypothetical protein n=1 Tax=Streptomyces sp. NPDC021100 TaxID=3365114 RepID=UPI0037BD1265